MEANSEFAIGEVLKSEGGFVNHRDDPGGATNLGITIGTMRRFLKPNATIQDVKNLTRAQAVFIYRSQYWDTVSGDRLPSGLDYAAFDYSINSGPGRARRELQKAVGASVDGIIGPQTLGLIEEVGAEAAINRLCDLRLAFMKRIRHRRTRKRLWLTFGRGWQSRVDHVRATSLRMAS